MCGFCRLSLSMPMHGDLAVIACAFPAARGRAPGRHDASCCIVGCWLGARALGVVACVPQPAAAYGGAAFRFFISVRLPPWGIDMIDRPAAPAVCSIGALEESDSSLPFVPLVVMRNRMDHLRKLACSNDTSRSKCSKNGYK